MKTKDIADFLSAELVGDPDIEINGIASLDSAATGEMSFSQNLSEFITAASAVIVQVGYEIPVPNILIKVADPKLAFARISRILHPAKSRQSWHVTAHIPNRSNIRASYIGAHVSVGEGSHIGELAQIHAGVRIGENVTIGTGTVIHPNCVIYDGAVIGSDCVIHAGTIIGSDGFGYVKCENGEHLQFPQLGSVTIEDRVEIGANCTLDRGALGPTIIGEGTKIDNMVHVAHNVQIGKRVLIAAQSGIAGSCVIGDDVVLGGQVGISDHVTIMNGAIIGAKSGVFPHKIVRTGFWSGIPAQPKSDYIRDIAHIRTVGKLKLEVDELKKRMEK